MSSSKPPRTSKKRKLKQSAWGAVPPPEESALPSSNGLSLRPAPLDGPRTLASCCISAFVADLRRVLVPAERGAGGDFRLDVRRWMGSTMPDGLRDRLWRALEMTGSGLISTELLSKYFVRSSKISLRGARLPAIANLKTLQSIAFPAFPNAVSHLELSELPLISDVAVAAVIRKCQGLEVLILRGTTNVGQRTVDAILTGSHAPTLRTLNMSNTSVKPPMLPALLDACVHLETLKLAGMTSLNDHALMSALEALLKSRTARSATSLLSLRNLKLRGSMISASSLGRLLALTPDLQALDLSLLPLRSIPQSLFELLPTLEKLHLTGASLNLASVAALFHVCGAPKLHTLHLGQRSEDREYARGAVAVLTEALSKLVREGDGGLKRMSLAGNVGLVGPAWNKQAKLDFQDFLRRVGRHLEHLDLSLIRSLTSEHLLPLSEPGSPLLALVLDETAMDPGLGDVLLGVPSLIMLSLKGSQVDVPCMFKVMERCPSLISLDLTSVRGVPLSIRRSFFEAWEEEQARRVREGIVVRDGVIRLDESEM